MDAPSETSQSEKPLWISQFDSQDPGLFFRDGKRRIDFVLVYSILDKNTTKARRREEFLRGLAQELIEIEVEDCYGRILGQTAKIPPKEAREPAIQPVAASNLNAAPIRSEKPEDDSDHIEVDRNHPSSMDRYRIQAKQREGVSLGSEDLVFVKLHAPWHVMTLYAEKFNFRKQLNVTQYGDLKKREKTSGRKAGCHCSCSNVNDASLPPLETTLTWPFNRRREFLYEIPPNKDEFFNPVERALVVDYILRRTRFAQRNSCPTEEIQQNPIVGITKLISEGVFLAAYPLHEPEEGLEKYKTQLSEPQEQTEAGPSKKSKTSDEFNNRRMLRRYWASFRSICRPQPLDYIRYYFGEAVAFYFAWLGFYTLALLPVAILGVLIFLFGLISIASDPIQIDVCEHGKNVIMCPLCSLERCKFWTLNQSCLRNKLTSLLDNEGNVIFGVVMALWAVIFLELWKRRQVSLAYRWNVFSLEPVDQPARPEFLALMDKGYKRQRNPISDNIEPMIPFWSVRCPCFVFSYATVLFAVILTLACLVGVILYKIVMRIVFYKVGNPTVQSLAGILTTATGSIINLILIFLLQMIYERIAIRLTDLEKHRTQLEYDNSLTLKLYMLQFVNYYSSIFYIAFIQGNTAALPGSVHVIVQSTGCDEGDCLFELFIQLIIIMVGKQVLSFVREMIMPWLLRLYHAIRHESKRDKLAAQAGATMEETVVGTASADTSHLLPCRADFNLLNPGSRILFDEYLEMMIQFGFITMFIPAFPLAPLFGLLNNLFELRGDAKKFVNQYRRPVVDRVKTIGIWYPILLVLSSIAIRTNACVIAFTTQFIDRWVYRTHYSPDQTNFGFKNFTLSFMPSNRFSVNSTSEYCRYDAYRKPPWEDPELSYTLVHYHVLAVKFIFVFLFETIAILLTSFIASIIPDVPQRVKTRIYREMNESTKIIMRAELHNYEGDAKSTKEEVRRDAVRQINEADNEDFPSGLMPMEFFPLYPYDQPPIPTLNFKHI